mgnify:CR=1 FL=1
MYFIKLTRIRKVKDKDGYVGYIYSGDVLINKNNIVCVKELCLQNENYIDEEGNKTLIEIRKVSVITMLIGNEKEDIVVLQNVEGVRIQLTAKI